MKLKKILKIVLGVIGILLLLIVLTVLFWLGPTVKLVAQTIGTKALGTPIHVENLSINPIKGIIHLTDFSIKNPDMFGQSNAISVASLDLAIDMSSIFTSTIVVHQVEINSPYFIYEQDLSSDNISEFISSIQQFAKIDPTAPPKPKKEKKKKKAGKPKEPKIVIVESLAINDVQFNLSNTHDEKLDIGVGFGQLAISMTNGTVRLDNLYVNNPKRLETPHLFTLDTVNIQMEPGSIYSTNIHFESVEIFNPHAFIEHNPETDTLGEFLKIASSLMAKIPTNTPAASLTNTISVAEAETTEPETPKAPPPEITLDMLVIDDVQLHSVNIGDPLLDVHLGLNHFSVALEDGRIELERLYLSNPARLSTPDLFSLDRFSLQITPGSHQAETLVIEDIQVIKPHVFLELNPESDTVREFLKIVKGYIDRVPTYEFPQLPPPQEAPVSTQPEIAVTPPNAPPPFELHNLTVDDIELQLLDLTDTNNPATGPHMIVGIEDVVLKLFEGKLQINNIRIPNTAGFTASNIFHLANIDVAMEPGSIHTDQFIINEVMVNSPTVNLEQTEDAGNVASLQTTLMKFVPGPDELPQMTSTPKATEEAHATEAKTPIPIAEQPLVLHQLLVTNLMVSLKVPVTTNGMVKGLGDSLELGKLNPFSKKQTPSDGVIDTEAPMELVGFSRLSLEPLKGMLTINALRISNPPGFSKSNLIEVEEFRIDLDPDTLQSDTLHIEDIMILKPRIRYERQLTTDNIKALQTEIEQAAMRRGEEMGKTNQIADAEAPSTTETAADVQTEPSAQKVIIDRVLIPNGMVQAKLSALPAIPVPLPTIELKDLGKETDGTSLADAGNKIFTSLYDAIIGSVGNATGFAGDALKGFGNLTFDTLENMVDGVTGTTKETDDTVEETTDDVEKKSKKRRIGGRRRLF